MNKPRLLDLFCCAGGAGMGYARAGFEVVGVDVRPQPRYPFEFIQADVMGLDPKWIASFDAIHASPPCQAHTAMKSMHNAKAHDDLIEPTLAILKASGLPWIMENVVGAPLRDPVLLCGTMFGLGVEDAELRQDLLRVLADRHALRLTECDGVLGSPTVGDSPSNPETFSSAATAD